MDKLVKKQQEKNLKEKKAKKQKEQDSLREERLKEVKEIKQRASQEVTRAEEDRQAAAKMKQNLEKEEKAAKKKVKDATTPEERNEAKNDLNEIHNQVKKAAYEEDQAAKMSDIAEKKVIKTQNKMEKIIEKERLSRKPKYSYEGEDRDGPNSRSTGEFEDEERPIYEDARGYGDRDDDT